MRRKTAHGPIRVLVLIAFAAFWMGVPRPPGSPGCRAPRSPMPLEQPAAPALPR
jgi:hypothetical protein